MVPLSNFIFQCFSVKVLSDQALAFPNPFKKFYLLLENLVFSAASRQSFGAVRALFFSFLCSQHDTFFNKV